METKKSPKADLERKRFLFFQAGMIIAISLALLAFEWKTYEKQGYSGNRSAAPEIMEILPDITRHEQPKPPAPPPIAVVNIKIVDDKPDFEPDDFIIDAESHEDDPIMDYVYFDDEPEDPDPTPFIVVEHMPEYPGGEAALYKFLADHVTYPQMAKEANITGTVFVSFIIERDGSVSEFSILKSPHQTLSQEAIRVLSMMPEWKPGLQALKPVRVQYTIPIKFNLSK